MKKCMGGCKMRAGGKTCMKCGCEMDEDESYGKGEKGEKKEMRSGGMACMKCGGKMHKSGGTVSSCMKCGGGKYTFGGKVNWSKKKVTETYAKGGMIKRADGSYSQRGLWDNIRANAGSGKEPTKQMLDQEKKIKQNMANGGAISKMKQYSPGGSISDVMAKAGENVIKAKDVIAKMIESKQKESADKMVQSKYTGKTSGGYNYYTDKEGFPVVNISDNQMPYNAEDNYDDELMVKPSKVSNTLSNTEQRGKGANIQLDYSLPNLGYGKIEQNKLNKLIEADIKAGAKDLELLEEDDIIGELTLAAMNKYEGKGYTRPEGFKDKWLKKYAEDYARGVRMQVPGVTAPLTPKVPGKEKVKSNTVKVEENQNKDDGYSLYDFGKDSVTVIGEMTGLKDIYDFFAPSISKIKTSPVTNKTTQKETPKKETGSFGFSDIISGLSSMTSGLQSGFNYGVKSLGDFLDYASNNIGELDIRGTQTPDYIKYAKGEMVSSKLQKRLKLKQEQKDLEASKRFNLLKSDLNYGLKLGKELGSNAISGLGNAYIKLIELGKYGQEQKDAEYEQLARDIESEYENEQKESYKNFGKRSAAAASKSAERYSKERQPELYKSSLPSMFPTNQPIIMSPQNESLPTMQNNAALNILQNIKGTVKDAQVKSAIEQNKRVKYYNDEAKKYMDFKLKTPSTKENIKYNINEMDKYFYKLETALDMLSSSSGINTNRMFENMTSKLVKDEAVPVERKYKNKPNEVSLKSIQTVNDDKYEELIIVKTFIDKQLNKIYNDPKYKDLDETDKKAVLTRALFEKRKEISDKKFAMKKQLKSTK